MRWFDFSVKDSYEYEDTAYKLDCIIEKFMDEGEIIEAVCHGLCNWRIYCTKETLLKIFDQLYD